MNSNRKQVAISVSRALAFRLRPAFPSLIDFAYVKPGLEKLKFANWSSPFLAVFLEFAE